MKIIGIIDMGSNSIRLVLVQITKNSYRIIDDVKHSVRLGKDILPNGNLHPIRMQKAVETLLFFKNLCDGVNVDKIVVVATEAVRKAANRKEFLDLVKQTTGLNVRVLKGSQEAFYDYFGVANSLDLSEALIMDIGGSSTELIWMKDKKICAVTSIPLGSIHISEQLEEAKGNVYEKERAVTNLLIKAYHEVGWLPHDIPLVGIGGSFRNIAKIDKKKKTYPLEASHNYYLTSERVQEIHKLILTTPARRRKDIKGLSPDRADIFWGATTAINALIMYCGISDVYVSGYGLREGLIFEYLLPDLNPVNDVLDFSLQNLMNNFNLNQKHAYHVWGLCRSMLEQLSPDHEIDPSQEKVLKTAALLHDCGINISYYDHHLHSFYTILNSRINGLSQRELLIAAYVAAYHRKSNFKISNDYKPLLLEEGLKTIRKLGVILKLAEALDRRMNGNVTNIECLKESEAITLRLLSESDHDLEAKEASDSAALFAKEFGKKLAII